MPKKQVIMEGIPMKRPIGQTGLLNKALVQAICIRWIRDTDSFDFIADKFTNHFSRNCIQSRSFWAINIYLEWNFQ